MRRISLLIIFLLLFSIIYIPAVSPLSWDNNFTWIGYCYNQYSQGTGEHGDQIIFYEPNASDGYPYKMICGQQPGPTCEQQYWRATNPNGTWYYVGEYTFPNQSVEGATLPSWGRMNETGYYYIYNSDNNNTGLTIYDSLDNISSPIAVYDCVFQYADTGGFYDPETGLWHIFYESYPVSDGDPCSWSIGHATSPNGIDNWTIIDDDCINISAMGYNWHTGDPDVIKIDDTYFMFIDHTDPNYGHPYYWIHVFSSKDLNNWTEEGLVTSHYGGDACVRYIPDEGKFYMWNELTNPSGGTWANIRKIGYQTCIGPWGNLSYQIDPTYNRMDIYISNYSSGSNNNLNFTDICGQSNNTILPIGNRWGNCTAPTIDDVPDSNAGEILSVEWYQVRVANDSSFTDVFVNETGLNQWWNLSSTVDYTGQHYYQYRCRVKVRTSG